jgi:hypothetical protein
MNSPTNPQLKDKAAPVKIVLALVLLAAAVLLFLKLSPARENQNGDAYFYDLEEQKLFVAPSGSIPPINGIKGAAQAGVRAIVIAPEGDPADKKHLQIAYLEKYTPEIKALFEEVHQARKEGRSEQGRIDRKEVAPNTLVRRLHDTEWQPITSAEGKKIASEWNTSGPDGRMPVVCSP